jgi:hypothetical protein
VKNSLAAGRRFLPPLLALAGATAGLAYGSLAARLPFGPPLVLMGLGGLSLVLCALALFRVLDPLLRPEEERLEAPQAPARIRELERDKQAVLKAIREIELDYQMRKLAESDYKEMLQRYRTRAMRIIRELDAGDNYRVLIEEELKTRLAVMAVAPAPAAPAPTTAACPACTTSNDADALFCKKCGQKLGGGA